MEVLNETHKDKLHQCRICVVLDAREIVFDNLVHCRTDCALWWVLKRGNLHSKAVNKKLKIKKKIKTLEIGFRRSYFR